MKLPQAVLSSAIIATALASGLASATERPPRIGEHKIVPKKKADDPGAAPVTPQKPVKRRAVRQILDDDVRPAAAPAAAPPVVYAPQLTVPPAQAGVPAAFTPSCVGAACTNTQGARYNSAAGGALIGPQGKLCADNGLTVQCH